VYSLFQSFLFQLDPETVHHLTLQLMRLGGVQPINALLYLLNYTRARPVEAFGLQFKNPVGLAAGYDKDGIAVRGLSALGFGHIEVGTVTPLPQPGNPKPRVFRLVEDRAVINRMGFPGRGAAAVVKHLSKLKRSAVILGVNLGKNKDTPNEEAVFDYLALLQNFAPLADYLTINVSSPNTVGLRRLQGRDALERLLSELHQQRHYEQIRLQKHLPLLVKLAPDLSDDELSDAVAAILDKKMDGIVATNTTLAREGLRSVFGAESGGLSGGPLGIRSEAVLEKIIRQVDGRVPIISVGGVMSPEDAKRRLDMGATLVQVYTGLIYRGPGLVKEIVKAVREPA
jgi:dihydroorotate dehydrogenase